MAALIQERCDHNKFADQLAQRMAPAVIVTPVEEIPATDRVVTRSDNSPTETSEIDRAKEAFEELRDFLKSTPVILQPGEAKLGAGYMERTRVALKAAREERETKTRPFMDRLAAIRTVYDLVREKSKTNEGGLLEKAYTALRDRMTKYADAVEAERIAEATRLREAAAEQERIAREAAATEQDAIDNATVGECTDVGAAIEQADQAFSTFQRADRLAAIAERAVPVRFKSVLGGKSLTSRTTEVLEIEDFAKAIRILGCTDKIRDAILLSAKDFRNEFGELPAGVKATFKRSM